MISSVNDPVQSTMIEVAVKDDLLGCISARLRVVITVSLKIVVICDEAEKKADPRSSLEHRMLGVSYGP